MYKLKIQKGGILSYNNNNNPNFFHVLYKNIELDDNVSLKDIFLLIYNQNLYDILSPILTNGPWLKEIIEEGLSQDRTDKNLSSLEVGNEMMISKSLEDDTDEKYLLNGNYLVAIDNAGERFAIDFSSTQELINLPIKINKNVILLDSEHGIYSPEIGKEVARFSYDFTLIEFLRAIFWELSFHGSIKDRDKLAEELKNIDLNDLKSFTSLDDFLKDIKEDDNANF